MSRAIVRGNEAGPRRAHAEGLGAGGVERIVEIELNADEQAAFEKSCDSVRELIEASRKLVG